MVAVVAMAPEIAFALNPKALLPRVSPMMESCGTISECGIVRLTTEELENLFRPHGMFKDMDAFFKTGFESKACGSPRTAGMYDWLMSDSR